LRGFDDIRVDIQGRLCQLLTKYKYLQDVSIRQFKNFIEIKIPIETLRYYGHEVKDELASLYKEIKDLNLEKLHKVYERAFNQLNTSKKLSMTSINRII